MLTPRPDRSRWRLRLGLQIRQLVLGLLGLGPDLAQARLELLDGGARGIDLGLGLGERQLIGRRIEAHQHVARRDDRMVADPHLDDAAGNFAGDLGDVCLDEGVLGRDVAAALQPEGQRAEQDEHGHADQRQSLRRRVRHGADPAVVAGASPREARIAAGDRPPRLLRHRRRPPKPASP